MLHHPPCWEAKLIIVFSEWLHLKRECEAVCNKKGGGYKLEVGGVLYPYSCW